jgi:hypothetical protein
LAFITVLLAIPYVFRLGFYGDDWWLIGKFANAPQHTFWTYFRLWWAMPIVHMRPIEVLYKTSLYWLFGTHALGYHLVNLSVLISADVLLYLSTRILVRSRIVAFAIPLLFAVLPNYSADRAVYFTFMIDFSVLMYLLNLYTVLRSAERFSWKLAAISIIALLLSALSYETALPLFALNIALGWWKGSHLPKHVARRFNAVLATSTVLVICAFIFKSLTTVRYHGAPSSSFIINIARSTAYVHLYDFGVKLPLLAWRSLARYPSVTSIVVAAVAFVLITVYVFIMHSVVREHLLARADLFRLSVAGLLALGLGSALFFLARGEVRIVSFGVGNRVNMAATLGSAILAIAGMAWLSIFAVRYKEILFRGLLVIHCVAALIVTVTVGQLWATAAQEQTRVLHTIRTAFPSLPPGTKLLLDGTCSYIGPGIVFDCNWDIKGALWLLYRDASIEADVVTPRIRLADNAVITQCYGRHANYPYGPNLLVYNTRTNEVIRLPDRSAAEQYFRTPASNFSGGCPPSDNTGVGAEIF